LVPAGGTGRGGTGAAGAAIDPSGGAVVVVPCIELPLHCFEGAAGDEPYTIDFDGAIRVCPDTIGLWADTNGA